MSSFKPVTQLPKISSIPQNAKPVTQPLLAVPLVKTATPVGTAANPVVLAGPSKGWGFDSDDSFDDEVSPLSCFQHLSLSLSPLDRPIRHTGLRTTYKFGTRTLNGMVWLASCET